MKYRITLNPRTTANHWRSLAMYWHLSAPAREKLEWIIFYYEVADENATETASYFNISRKTFHKWLRRFDPKRIQSLEETSRRPNQVRQWQVTPEEEQRIVELRETFLQYGKQKLKVKYERKYGQSISTWKIERVIRKHHLFPDPKAHLKLIKKRRKSREKVRIHSLNTSSFPAGTLWHIDSIVTWWYDQYRTIVTALEDKTKLGFARVYSNHTSKSAADFLERLIYLSDGKAAIIHSDNGSEFAGKFEAAIKEFNLTQVYSRVRWPKDNPCLERFNKTIQDEWLNYSEVGLDKIEEANQDLTKWLIEYNFGRPHESLDYLTPIEYAHTNYFQVLPMYPASTFS